MQFKFVQPEQVFEVPSGFCLCPDGGLAVDDPSLTKLVSVTPFDPADAESPVDIAKTSRWHNSLGWVPLARYKEWAADAQQAQAQSEEESV